MADRNIGDDGRAEAIAAVGVSSRSLTQFAMAVLFFGLITPVAIVMRLAGRDRLRLRRNPGRKSYWVMPAVPPERQAATARQI